MGLHINGWVQPISGEVEGEVHVQGEVEVHVQNESHEVDNEVQNETYNKGVQEQNAEEVEVEDGCSRDNIDEDSDGLIHVDIDCDPGVGGSHWTSTRSRKKINHNQKTNEMKKHARGLFDNEWGSDELVSNEGSDSNSSDEDTCGNFPTFCMPKSMAEYEWQVGTYFVNK